MSLSRFVYYSAIIGGWAALAAWAVLEAVLLRGGSEFGAGVVTATGAVVGAAIGAGLNLVSGMANAQWTRQIRRAAAGVLGGGIGGALGGLAGQAIVFLTDPSDANLPFVLALGWVVMGAAIGVAEGSCDRSITKVRNGLLGGTLGGLLGGLLFAPVSHAGSDLSGRALAFTILGISIGALIGLTHVALRQAWLTVLEGFRPGRQLILGQTVTMLGRGDHLPLPLLGIAGRDIESEHARITRTPDGRFAIEDNHSRIGTLVNGKPIHGAAGLADGDLIRLGSNILRFSLRSGRGERAVAPPVGAKPSAAMPLPPPPPGGKPQSPLPAPNVPASAIPAKPPSQSGGRIPPPPPPPRRQV
jgi:hypothetical protein